MSNFNIVAIQGNLVNDAETVGSEGKVTRFTIANNTGFGDRKRTNYIDCVAFGKTAEIVLTHFTKGKQVIVNGQLIQNRWQNAEGETRSRMEVQLNMVNGFSFVSGGPRSEASPSDDAPAAEATSATSPEGGEGAEGGDLF